MDKRTEPRIAHNVRFFVHIKACEEDPELVGLSLESTAVDFSKRGMQFRTDAELAARTELGITIGVGEPFAMFELYGSVRWVRQDSDGFSMGVLLEERENTDYAKWEREFASIFNQQSRVTA